MIFFPLFCPEEVILPSSPLETVLSFQILSEQQQKHFPEVLEEPHSNAEKPLSQAVFAWWKSSAGMITAASSLAN